MPSYPLRVVEPSEVKNTAPFCPLATRVSSAHGTLSQILPPISDEVVRRPSSSESESYVQLLAYSMSFVTTYSRGRAGAVHDSVVRQRSLLGYDPARSSDTSATRSPLVATQADGVHDVQHDAPLYTHAGLCDPTGVHTAHTNVAGDRPVAVHVSDEVPVDNGAAHAGTQVASPARVPPAPQLVDMATTGSVHGRTHTNVDGDRVGPSVHDMYGTEGVPDEHDGEHDDPTASDAPVLQATPSGIPDGSVQGPAHVNVAGDKLPPVHTRATPDDSEYPAMQVGVHDVPDVTFAPVPQVADPLTVGSVQGDGSHVQFAGVSTPAAHDRDVADRVYPALQPGEQVDPSASVPPEHVVAKLTLGMVQSMGLQFHVTVHPLPTVAESDVIFT